MDNYAPCSCKNERMPKTGVDIPDDTETENR